MFIFTCCNKHDVRHWFTDDLYVVAFKCLKEAFEEKPEVIEHKYVNNSRVNSCMPIHEQKTCPRCNHLFECKVGDVSRCECSSINIPTEVSAFIESKYQDCLCKSCLKTLANKYNFFMEKYLFR